MSVALLMVGCGEGQNSEDSNDTENNASALTPPVAQPVKVPFVEKWDEWEANPEIYGGPVVLAKIKEAKGSGATTLDLNNNQISDVTSLKELTKLVSLELYSNQISNVTPLAGLTKLVSLNLYSNQISDLLPLAGLTKLESLTLGDNSITDVSPLAELTNLEELYLTGNQISDISPLASLTKLRVLGLYGNPIPDDQKAMLKKALPDCDIKIPD